MLGQTEGERDFVLFIGSIIKSRSSCHVRARRGMGSPACFFAVAAVCVVQMKRVLVRIFLGRGERM